MISGEWTLIVFSLLTQCAVGTWLVTMILRAVIARRADQSTAYQLTRQAVIVVGPLISIALVTSIFHLGSPMLAYGSIANLGTSWLSREIVSSGLFLFLWIITYYVNYRKGSAGRALVALTSLLGILAVFSMASIYYYTPVPAWSTVHTYLSFFAAALILGSLISALLLSFASRESELKPEIRKLVGKLAIVALVAAILQLIFPPAVEGSYSLPLLMHRLLLVAGAVIFAGYWQRMSQKPEQKVNHAVIGTYIGLIVAGEVLGRYLFYTGANSLPIF